MTNFLSNLAASPSTTPAPLAPELLWLGLVSILTGLLWTPYILNRMREHGAWPAIHNSEHDPRPRTPWADRLQYAHENAVENLVVFAALALAVVVAERGSPATAAAAATYFCARLAHVVIYTLGVPVLRTVAFMTGVVAQGVLAVALLS
ncbi:MAG: MAPEG family protein [Myxococcota bacterium]